MRKPKIRFGFIVFSLLSQNLFAGYANFAMQFASQPEKFHAWQEMAKIIDQTTDGLGFPVDEKIKEVVIVLNLLGFETISSCEGHLERGDPSPWINIRPKQLVPDALVQELNSYIKQEQDIDRSTMDAEEKREELFAHINALWTQKDRHILQQALPVHQLLEEFYTTSNRPCYQVQIGEEHLFLGEIHIYIPDSRWQILRDENERKAKLIEYRQEMERFADFLIEKFLNIATS